MHQRRVVDFDLDLLVEIVGTVDRLIGVVEAEISRSADPDGLGLFNRLEGVVGLGFVACQQYLNATYPQLAAETKRAAFLAGPKHPSGRSVAELVNAAANYWKHREEWGDANSQGHETRTREVIDSVTPSRGECVVGNVLAALVGGQAERFSSLVGQVVQWRDQQIRATV
jgi:hypothetical protein